MAAKAKEIFNDLNLVLRLNQHIEELTADEASRAALLAKESSFKVLAELTSLETPDPREDAQFEHQRAGFGDAATLPFHLQGDQAFNEASALARRRQLRHSEAVKAKIQFLWQVARGRKAAEQLSLATASSERLRRPSGASATINEREYTEMMLLIFKVLCDDFVLETAERQIQCDWEVDSRHGLALSYEQFFPALFELVDVWTCDILEDTYARFLELLTRRITVRVVVFLDDMKLKLALSDNFDEAVVVKAIPLSTIKQFASVAKALEGSGVRTVGELASADPRDVETQRIGYLDKNAFSKDKIGADLQHLLDMFREISGQFHDANYSLQNMVLQRMSPVKREPGDSSSDRAGSFGSKSTDVTKRDGDDRVSGDSGVCSTTTESSSRMGSGNNGMNRGNESWVTMHSGSNTAHRLHGVEGGRGSLARQGAETDVLRRGGLKRINTFHDISVTETGVIDALKTTFLIEKGISIQRKSSIESVQDELVKFGVDTKGMDERSMREKYDTLYETFVLRDGENIKALAQSTLSRIKMELAAHGIEVNEDEMEAIYDGFYGSVIAGSGDRMVADAKNWVDETLASSSYGAYVKQEYHELKSIDEVSRLGSGTDDEEFMSLLSKEDDEDEDEDGSDRMGSSSPSPTAKVLSTPLSRRSSLYRGLSQKHQKSGDTLQWAGDVPTAETSVTANLTQDRLALSSTASSDNVHSSNRPLASYPSIEDPINRSSDRSLNSSNGASEESIGTDKILANNTDLQPPLHEAGPKCESTKSEECAQMDIQCHEIGVMIPYDEVLVAITEGSSIEQSKLLEDDPDLWTRTVGGLKQSRSKPDLLDADSMSNLGGNHADFNESDREPQGVEFGYEDKTDQKIVDEGQAAPDRIQVQEPKVPDIIVSGVESGKHIAVTARYIQLLGLGNVTTIVPENKLLARLATDTSLDLLCFDIGDELDTAVARAQALVELVGRRVILFGGDVSQPEKSEVIARLCVSEGGVVYFAILPLDFPALRGEIQAIFDASPHLYISRQRRPTTVFGAAAKLLSTSIRATNMISVEEDHPRSVLTPPLSVDNNSAKRKATATLSPAVLLPQVVVAKREAFTPFRPLRVIDEMPGADLVLPVRYSPVVPAAHASKVHRKSPRMSAALKKLMR